MMLRLYPSHRRSTARAGTFPSPGADAAALPRPGGSAAEPGPPFGPPSSLLLRAPRYLPTKSPATAVAVQDGRVAVGDQGGSISVFSAADGAAQYVIDAAHRPSRLSRAVGIAALGATPDAWVSAGARPDRKGEGFTVRLWGLADGVLLARLAPSVPTMPVRLDADAEGRPLALEQNNDITWWNMAHAGSAAGHGVWQAATGAGVEIDGGAVASDDAARITISRAGAGASGRVWVPTWPARASAFAAHPRGGYLGRADGTVAEITVSQTRSGAEEQVRLAAAEHVGPVTALAASSDWVASADATTLHLYRPASLECAARLPLKQALRALRLAQGCMVTLDGRGAVFLQPMPPAETWSLYG